MKNILGPIKKELTEKGYIEKDLLVWARRKITTFNPTFIFFGIKDGKLMIIPFKDIKTVHYDQIKSYGKDTVAKISYGGFTSIFKIHFRNGDVERYAIFGTDNGKEIAHEIVAAFNSG